MREKILRSHVPAFAIQGGGSFSVALRQLHFKEATESYIQEVKDAVAAIAERKQGRQASAPERPPKHADSGQGARPSVPRAVPERVNGPVAAPSLSWS